MIRFKPVIWLWIVFVLASVGCDPSDTTPSGTSDPVDNAEFQPLIEDEILTYTNNYRAQHGLNPLYMREDVRTVARQHSLDMLDRNFFDHTNPDGESPADRLKNAHISYTAWAENIALNSGATDPASTVMNQWINSEGHRLNILNTAVTHIGIGVVRAGETYYYTQLFMRP
ncbi:MAG: CAP domain-containing protein [Gemmatimonadetes bacterium]|nr:MAG: CAP domain-containing protein [Gemmatimonadota bacterium]